MWHFRDHNSKLTHCQICNFFSRPFSHSQDWSLFRKAMVREKFLKFYFYIWLWLEAAEVKRKSLDAILPKIFLTSLSEYSEFLTCLSKRLPDKGLNRVVNLFSTRPHTRIKNEKRSNKTLVKCFQVSGRVKISMGRSNQLDK